MTLAVYCDDESEACFVAESPEHAFTMLLESELVDEDLATIEGLKRQRDDANLIIYTTDEDGNLTYTIKTHREWCESNGPGILCWSMD